MKSYWISSSKRMDQSSRLRSSLKNGKLLSNSTPPKQPTTQSKLNRARTTSCRSSSRCLKANVLNCKVSWNNHVNNSIEVIRFTTWVRIHSIESLTSIIRTLVSSSMIPKNCWSVKKKEEEWWIKSWQKNLTHEVIRYMLPTFLSYAQEIVVHILLCPLIVIVMHLFRSRLRSSFLLSTSIFTPSSHYLVYFSMLMLSSGGATPAYRCCVSSSG